MPIYFIRHGQSAFNAVYDPARGDPLIFDAPLTAKGEAEARSIRAQVSKLGIKRVISSPLTRAVQTALHAFEGLAPITVEAMHREYITNSCDVGRSPAVLSQEFPALSFDHLAECWWHRGPENDNGVPLEPEHVFKSRVREFDAWLSRQTEKPMAIVGHGNVFREMTGFMLKNCEIFQYSPSEP